MEAVKVAIDLLHVPSRVRQARLDPLPKQTLTLLRIAAGETDVIESTALIVDRPGRVIEEAASFFIEQVMFCSDADSYRVLGCTPNDSSSDLRRNMALLSRWVHPDLDRKGARAPFATRVSRAWDDLKTPERRLAYDARRLQPQPKPNARFRTGSPGRFQANHARELPSPQAMVIRPGQAGGSQRPPGLLRRTLARLLRRD